MSEKIRISIDFRFGHKESGRSFKPSKTTFQQREQLHSSKNVHGLLRQLKSKTRFRSERAIKATMENEVFKFSFGIALVVSGIGLNINCHDLQMHAKSNGLYLLGLLNIVMLTQSVFAQFLGRTVFHEMLGAAFILGLAFYPFIRFYSLLSLILKETGVFVYSITLMSVVLISVADYGVVSPAVGIIAIVIGFIFPFVFDSYLIVVVEPMLDNQLTIRSQTYAQLAIVTALTVFLVSVFTATCQSYHEYIDVPNALLAFCVLFFSISEHHRNNRVSNESEDEEQNKLLHAQD